MPPVPLPFPVSALPGRRPGEGQGDLVNVYARKVGDLIRWQRVPGTLRFTPGNGTRTYLPSTPPRPMFAGMPRGQLAIQDTLLSVWGDKVVRTLPDGSESVLTGVSLIGTDPVTMAHNLRAPIPDVVAVAGNSAYFIDLSALTVAAYPDIDISALPPNSVDYHSGYFVWSRGDGTIFASDLQTTVTNPLSFDKAEAVPDRLLRMYSSAPVLLACGSESIEVLQDAGTSPYPFQLVTVLPVGLLGTWAIAGGTKVWDRPLCFVAHDKTVRQLRGSDPVIVSTDDVAQDIEIEARAGRAEQLYAQAYTFGESAVWSLSSPSWTWEYNLSTAGWHRRRSYRPGTEAEHEGAPWRAVWSVHYKDKWVAQDAMDGALIEITSAAHSEPDVLKPRPHPGANEPPYLVYQTPLIARCESAPMKAQPANIRMPAIYLDFSVGFDVDGVEEPSVMLSWSHDGGATWASPVQRHLGGEGEFRTLVTLRSTGRSSHQGMRLRWECADPIPIAFHGAIAPRTATSYPRQVGVVVTGGGLGSGG
jgi:hypothetical protein